MLRTPGVKFFTDGGSKGCGEPAFGFPEDNPRGLQLMTAEELAAALQEVQAAGYQAAIHAVGDRGVETALDAVESALDGRPNTYRHRIEHNNLIMPDQLPRYGELGVVPIIFGDTHTCQTLDGAYWSNVLLDVPEENRPLFEPWRQLLDANPVLHVAFHSDAPRSGPLEPMTNLWSLVTRKSRSGDGSICDPPDWVAAGAVTVEQALRMMTVSAAYALAMDEHIGSLEPGKVADLVILSESPLTVDPDAIIEIEVLMTMVGGTVEHCMAGHEALCPDRIP